MRRNNSELTSDYKIMVLDDEIGIIDSISVILKRSGYGFTGFTDPMKAIDRLRTEHFDLLILDYIMQPIHGDMVVKKIREFNNELYILLLTGHKDLAPPLETIKALDIQGYCEKSDRFDQLLLLVESGIKSVAQLNTIKKFKDGLNQILKSLPKMYHLQPLTNILDDILNELKQFVKSEDAFILIDDTTDFDGGGEKSIYRGIGRFNTDIGDFMRLLSPGMMEGIGFARTRKELFTADNVLILPLINEVSKAIGVMFVEGNSFDENIKLLEIYARQVATSINNALLHSLVNRKNDELNSTYAQLKIRYMDTIEVLRLAVDAKDVYTRGHSDRVADWAVKIGSQFKLSCEQLEILRVAGIFHDIGKIGTADDILLKTDKLTLSEYEEIKKHPLKGAQILSAVSMFKDAVVLVECHHERIDGKGYPAGLKDDEIPFMARILAVADAFDAMTSDRLYRPRLNLNEAKKQLISGIGSQFDGEVVKKFIDILDDNLQGY